MRLNIFQKGLLLISLPLLFWIIFAITLTNLLKGAEAEILREATARTMIYDIDQFRKEWSGAIATAAMLSYSQQPGLERRLDKQVAAADAMLQQAKSFSTENTESRKYLRLLEQANQNAKQRLQQIPFGPNPLERLLKVQSITDSAELSQLMERWLKNTPESEHPFERMRYYEDLLLESENKIQVSSQIASRQARTQLQTLSVFAVVFNVLFTVILVAVFSRTITSRLAIVIDNTKRLVKRERLVASVSGSDEIAELDHVLHTTAAELNRLEEFKKELTAMVTHELRTPLTSLQSVFTVLRIGALGPLSQEAQDKVVQAEANAGRLIRLINELLDIEKMEAGKMEINIEDTDLRVIVIEAVEAIRDFANSHSIKIELQNNELEVRADPSRIVQVLINLLSNAIKYSPDGGTVRIQTFTQGAFATVQIIDKGAGISAENQEIIFAPFQQLGSESATKMPGTGLGLAICKAIMTQHSGRIGVTSTQGLGSTFSIQIPLATAQTIHSSNQNQPVISTIRDGV